MDHEKSLQDIIFNMMCNNKHTFYGLFMAELNKSFDDKFPTACVGKHASSANIALVIGKDFWEKTLWNDKRKRFIIIHELEHVIREHLSDISQGMFNDKLVANIAMDVAINQDINGDEVEAPTVDEKGQKIGAFIDDFPELSLKRNESSLYYYGEFMKAKQQKQDSKGKEDSKNPNKEKGNKRGTSGSEYLDQFLDGQEDGTQGDWHELWDEITKGMGEKEVELLRKEMQETLKRIADETQKLRGTVPAHLMNAVNENFGRKDPVISWKTLFNRFIGSTMTTEIRQTRKRPNFRFEDAPTNKYKNKVRIVVGCDTSGSVSEQELQEFFGQIRHMWNAGVKIDICLWDATCEDPYEYKGEHTYRRTKCGGTRASCFIEHVNENSKKKNWTCAINLTDGYIESDPVACKLPMLWVITASGNTSFNHKGKKIKMN